MTSSSSELGGIEDWEVSDDFIIQGNPSSSSLSSSSLSSQSNQPLPEGQTRRAVIVTLENDDVLVNREHRNFDLIGEQLVNLFGFEISSRLKDAEATIKNVESAIVSATINMSPGDAFVFAFGGHGSRVFDMDDPKDELDTRDEGRVLYDGFWRDDRIRALIDAMPAGIKITFILDSCYSGNGTRAVKRQKNKAIDEENMRELLFASSKEDQVSYLWNDYSYYSNAFLYVLQKSSDNVPSMTAQKFHEEVKSHVWRGQTPQLEGPAYLKNSRLFV
jgi:hypothetical protein